MASTDWPESFATYRLYDRFDRHRPFDGQRHTWLLYLRFHTISRLTTTGSNRSEIEQPNGNYQQSWATPTGMSV